MILKCSYCGEKMSVEEPGLPPGKKFRVRCPHCRGIGVSTSAPTTTASGLQGEAGPKDSVRGPSAPSPTPPTERGRRPREEAVKDFEPSMPDDAFTKFRFPAEEEVTPDRAGRKSTGRRILIWTAASLGIILAFAVVVNLILPGPPR